jgi:hypothetical protein
MVICPIARAVHCTGCLLFKVCPAKTVLGDYGKEGETGAEKRAAQEKPNPDTRN